MLVGIVINAALPPDATRELFRFLGDRASSDHQHAALVNLEVRLPKSRRARVRINDECSQGSNPMSPNVRYVTDQTGERTAVILPIEEYEELLEDLHLIRVAYESKDEPRRPFEEVVEEMRTAGEIDV